LGIKKIRTSNSRYKPRATDVIVNWGNTTIPVFAPARVLNTPQAVANSSNKLTTFRLLEEAGVNIPLYTTEAAKVVEWLKNNYVVVGRQLLRAGEGRGIVMLDPADPDVLEKLKCPLYTLYRKKKDEYRVHVMNGKVIDAQKKRRAVSDGRWKGDNRIRNSLGGWVFTRENISVPKDVLEASTKAVGTLGLDFGAVDCGYSVSRARATVYEVNSAAGVTATTLERYAKGLEENFATGYSKPRRARRVRRTGRAGAAT